MGISGKIQVKCHSHSDSIQTKMGMRIPTSKTVLRSPLHSGGFSKRLL